MSALHLGFAASLGCALLWSVLDVLRKQLAARMDAVGLAVWLAIGQAPVLACWVAADPGPVAAAYWPWAAATVLFNVIAAVLYLGAVGSGQFSVAIPMLAFVPVWTALLGIPLLDQIPTSTQFVGIAAVVVGAMLLHANGRPGLAMVTAMLRERVSLAMLGVALCWALTIVLDRRATVHAPLSVHALALAVGIAIGATGWLAWRRRLGELLQARRAPGRLVAAAIVAAVAMALQLRAMQDVDVAVLEAIKRTVGMAAAIALGRLVFGELVTRRKLIAVLVMAMGTLLVVQG